MERKELKKFNEEKADEIPHEIYYNSENQVYKWVFQQRIGSIKRALELCENPEKIVDIGCGDGWMTKHLSEHAKITAVDISAKRIKRAVKLLQQNNETYNFLVVDAEELPLKSNAFNVALSSSTLDHLPTPKKAIEEMKRVIAPEGFIVINLENKLSITYFVQRIFQKPKTIDAYGHFHAINYWRLKRILSKSDLKIKKIIGHGAIFEYYRKILQHAFILRYLLDFIGKNFPVVASELTVVCKKNESQKEQLTPCYAHNHFDSK